MVAAAQEWMPLGETVVLAYVRYACNSLAMAKLVNRGVENSVTPPVMQ